MDTEHFSSWHLDLLGNITAFLVLSALPSRKEQAGDPDKAGGTRVRKERNERHQLDSSSHAHQNSARLCAPLEEGFPGFCPALVPDSPVSLPTLCTSHPTAFQ